MSPPNRSMQIPLERGSCWGGAIQAAINFSQDHRMIAFFPPGIYKVSRTIECRQDGVKEKDRRVGFQPQLACGALGLEKGQRTGRRWCLHPNHPALILIRRNPDLMIWYHGGEGRLPIRRKYASQAPPVSSGTNLSVSTWRSGRETPGRLPSGSGVRRPQSSKMPSLMQPMEKQGSKGPVDREADLEM